MELTIAQLAQRLGAELIGDGSAQIKSVGAIKTADENTITFLTDSKHSAELETSLAAAVIVGEQIKGLSTPQLIAKDVNAALIEALNIFAPQLTPPTEGIDPTAQVADSARIAKGASIGPGAVIAEGVCIGEKTVIAAGCKIGQNTSIGKNCRLDSNVVVEHNCTIGNNVIIQPNTTIGSTGFGYCFINGTHRLIPHNGGVVIEDFVEIGANSCVDRAKFGNTVIGAGTKIDNLVQIAHNVVIGKCCLIAGEAGISGSCKLGNGVVLAGGVGLVDNIEIGDGVTVGVYSLVTHNIPAGQQLFGIPAMEKGEAFRLIGQTRRLPKVTEQLKQLNERVQKLERRLRFLTRLKQAAAGTAAATVILAGFFLSPYARAVLEPHEYKVEQLVKKYQDGNDNFYVSANSHLENLHGGKDLFVISDVSEAPERILADHARMKDSYFLLSYKDLQKLKETSAWGQLLLIGEVDVEGQELVLLGTEASANLVPPPQGAGRAKPRV